MTAIEAMRGFDGPAALDLLAEFRKKYVVLAERRSAELKATIQAAIDADRDRMIREGKDGYDHPSEIREMIDEYESLRYFEQELNRVISAFVNEATKPWRQAYTDALMAAPTPGIFYGMVEK